MTPVEAAAAVYQSEPCARSFVEDVEAHLLNGYVFNTPEFFLMARLVCSRAAIDDIVNPWLSFDPIDCDTWLIYLAAGRMERFFQAYDFIGVKKEWLAWERKNAIRWHKFDRTRSLCCRSTITMNVFAGRSTTAKR